MPCRFAKKPNRVTIDIDFRSGFLFVIMIHISLDCIIPIMLLGSYLLSLRNRKIQGHGEVRRLGALMSPSSKLTF
jgi:hypothetical protein